MIYQKTNPVGVDYEIDLMQSRLYSQIQSLWLLTTDQICAFGRVSLLKGKEKDTLVFYNSNTGNTLDVLLDDKYIVKYFFNTVGKADYYDSVYHQEMEIVFFVNLTTVKPLITHRADEEVRRNLRSILPRPEAFKGFDSVVDMPGFEERMDMQPNHSFKILTTLVYA